MNIRTKLLGGFFCIWVGLSAVLLYTHFLHDRDQRDRSDQFAASRANDALAQAIVQSMSQGHKGGEVSSLLSAMALARGFQRAEIVDMDGTPSWSSGALPASRDADRELIGAASGSGAASRMTPDGWVAVHLLPREAACLPCHAGTSRWVGATLTQAGADPLAQEARTKANVNLLFLTLGTGLLGLIGAWLVINRSLVRPLSDMASKFQAITPDNWAASRIRPTPEGEIGVLAAHFNGMLDRIAQTEVRLVQDDAERQHATDERETILRTALDGFVMISGEGRIEDVNDAYCQLIGYSREELRAMAISEVTAKEALDGTLDELRQTATAGGDRFSYASTIASLVMIQRIAAAGSDRFETRHRRKDGRLVDLEVSASPMGDGRVFAFLRDISARREAEERLARSEAQLRQSQKMEAVGRLAGGIAHDFNNLLTAILGYSESLLESMNEQDPWRADIEEIRKAGMRAASLTRQMLAFSRKQVLELKVLDINTIATDTKNMLRRLIGEDIELLVVTSPKPARANVDQGHMEQVLLNLAVNARDAMPTGGKLTIEVDVIRLDEEYTHTHGTVQPGSYVLLSVSDTGCGMSREVQTHLFEPFFTTKERGKGTGLGLSTVYGIITQSGGHISVYSERGHGSSFKVYLPYVGDAAELTTAAEPQPPSFVGTAVLLLVEDDASVRKLTSRMLAADGFTVLEAGTGEEALALCQHHAGPIQLMLADMVLPKMTGPELAGHVASLRPETRVIFMSGYSDHALFASKLLEMGKTFIQKPFSPKALIQKIRIALAAP